MTVSSEIAPLISLYGFSKPDEIGIRQYLKLRAFFNVRTYLQKINMFPAGYYINSQIELKFKVSKNLLKSNGIEFKRVEDAQENKFIEENYE